MEVDINILQYEQKWIWELFLLTADICQTRADLSKYIKAFPDIKCGSNYYYAFSTFVLTIFCTHFQIDHV